MFWNLINPLENTRLEFFYHSARLQTRKITIKNSSTGTFSVAFSRFWISHILAKISFHLQENWTIFFFRSLCHSSKIAKMSETYIMTNFEEMLVDTKNNCLSFFSLLNFDCSCSIDRYWDIRLNPKSNVLFVEKLKNNSKYFSNGIKIYFANFWKYLKCWI